MGIIKLFSYYSTEVEVSACFSQCVVTSDWHVQYSTSYDDLLNSVGKGMEGGWDLEYKRGKLWGYPALNYLMLILMFCDISFDTVVSLETYLPLK